MKMRRTKAVNEGKESKVNCCSERVFIFAVPSDMKERNYLASNNKVNGLIIEEAWRSRAPPSWLMLAFDSDGGENELDTIWKSVTAGIVMGEEDGWVVVVALEGGARGG